ncbi:MAG: DUF1634 domain-containing protein [Thermomicrobiales bacterium]|nr:DUF1634 domain-containing protein [Thermomicrobiales bacterium]
MLRYEFYLSAVVLAVGAIWSLIDRHPLSPTVLPFQEIPGAILDRNPSALIDLGILIMMLTPVVTALSIALNFSRLGERKFVTITLGVLAILATSIAISLLR